MMKNVSVTITGIGSELQGVGRLPDGRAVFVPFALPDETVAIEITREAERFCEGRIRKIAVSSPHRVAPRCPHYGVCGGCRAQHMTYEYSLQLKKQRITEALRRIGHIEDPLVADTLPSPRLQRARNKAEYPIAGERIGCYEAGTHRVIDVPDCLLQSETSVAAAAFVRAHGNACPALTGLVTRINRTGEMMAVFSVRRADAAACRALAQAMQQSIPQLVSAYMCVLRPHPAHALDGAHTHLLGADTLTDTLSGLTFTISPQSFFQVNPPQAEALYAAAVRMADLCADSCVIDAYCGAGTISLVAAQTAAHVTGVEIVPEAIADAIHNASCNHLSEKTEFIVGDAARQIPLLMRNRACDALIVDPPRKGMDEKLIRCLLETNIPRIVYVSCNPATLARDVGLLTADGPYRFVQAQGVDMFPLTEHVETVCLLSRKAP